MKDVEGFFNIVDRLVGTPLYLIMCIGLIIFFVYYFWKVAPSRYKAFEDLIKDNSKQATEIFKIASQYEKSLDNSNKVIENNTAALKSTQAMLELLNSKVDEAIDSEKDVSRKLGDYSDKLTDMHITLAGMNGKLN